MATMGPCLVLVVLVAGCVAARMPAQYTVGVGMADITGPAAEVNMVGNLFIFLLVLAVGTIPTYVHAHV